MIRMTSGLFWFSLVLVASLALYRTSDRVHDLDQQLRDLNAAIENQRESIHVLNAEWVYLANPARLENAAKKYLALRATAPRQIARIGDLAEILPTRREAMASVAVTATPIANVHAASLAALAPRPVSTRRRGAEHEAAVASADAGHINDHIVIQHTAEARRTPDSIGTLIAALGTRP